MDKQEEARQVIEDAIGRLAAIGLTAEAAATLLVVQGAIRITSPDTRQDLARLLNEPDPTEEFVSVYLTRGFVEL